MQGKEVVQNPSTSVLWQNCPSCESKLGQRKKQEFSSMSNSVIHCAEKEQLPTETENLNQEKKTSHVEGKKEIEPYGNQTKPSFSMESYHMALNIELSSLSCCSVAHWLDWLGGARQTATGPMLEQQWLVLVGHARIHHRAVPIPTNACWQALQGFAPANLVRLVARPHDFAIKMCYCALSVAIRSEIHKSMAQDGPVIETVWNVEEIIRASETLGFQQLLECCTRAAFRNVTDHYCGACSAPSTNNLPLSASGRADVEHSLIDRRLLFCSSGCLCKLRHPKSQSRFSSFQHGLQVKRVCRSLVKIPGRCPRWRPRRADHAGRRAHHCHRHPLPIWRLD